MPPPPPPVPDPPRRARSGGGATPAAPVRPAPPVSTLWWITGPVSVVLFGAIVVVLSLHVPYITLSPGGARPVEDLVQVKALAGGPKVTSYRADHDLLYLTVSVGNPTAFEALLGVLDPKTEVEPSEPYRGTQSPNEDRKLNLQLMSDSQDKARKVALERLGYKVVSNPIGAFLEDVDPTYPAAEVLKPGATITAADGKPVRTKDQLVAAIQAHRPGGSIRLTFTPLGAADPVTEAVKLGTSPSDPTVAALGVAPVDRVTYTFPVAVAINTREVGGPSAGLAFTLAILDRMTPGDLLGRQRVAVTGTIEVDGSVGPVGGVDHKAEAAISQGAKLMLVPSDEYALAKKAAGDRLDVEKVDTLDQALAILRRHGGDPLPTDKAP